jgi:hypothetical protein
MRVQSADRGFGSAREREVEEPDVTGLARRAPALGADAGARFYRRDLMALNRDQQIRAAALEATALATGLTAGQVVQILNPGREFFEAGVERAERQARRQAKALRAAKAPSAEATKGYR